LDIMMPKLDGLSFLKALRDEPNIHQPIIVILTFAPKSTNKRYSNPINT